MSNETFSPNTSANASDLILTLRQRAPRIAMTLAAGQMLYPVAKTLRGKLNERRTYTIKVPSTDEIYDDLHEWVLGLLPTKDQRALVAWTSKRSDPMVAYPEGGRVMPPRLRLRYDGSREQVITLSGHRVKVAVNDPEGPVRDDGRFKPAEIVFSVTSLDARLRLIDEMEHVIVGKAARKPRFRMLAKWGEWQTLDDLPERTLESVVLPDGQLERLVSDVGSFLGSEADYLRRCIPWHRGHLYEGPPGTGKTSVARAVASHFGMDIWYLPLSDLDKDCNLLTAVNRITPRSMLLLEDVDVFHAATQRNDDNGVTLSGLLNALDGITTPHGLLTVLTTNTPDALDKAVVRPGRVDLVEHFGLASDEQIERLVSRWYGQPVRIGQRLDGVSPAEVVEACKRHEDNPIRAIDDIARLQVRGTL